MGTINLYIARQILTAVVFVTASVTFAVWLTQSLRFMDYIVNRGLPLSSYIALVALLVPAFLPLLLPIALFIATLFVFNKLATESELIVLRAAGMSPLRIGRPAIAIAVLIAIVCYGMTTTLMPLSYRAFKEWQFRIRNDYARVALQDGVFNQLTKGVTVYVRDRDPGGELIGLLIYDARDPKAHVTMMAERGAVVQLPTGPRVLLLRGNRQAVDRKTGRISVLYFDSYTADFALDRDNDPENRWRETQERYLPELFAPGDAAQMSEKTRRQLRAEGHQRLVSPLYALAFPLVAMSAMLLGDFSRRGQTKRLLVAAGVVVGLQILALGAQNLTALWPPLVPAMYLCALAPTVVCLWLLGRRRLRRPPPYSGPARAEIAAAAD